MILTLFDFSIVLQWLWLWPCLIYRGFLHNWDYNLDCLEIAWFKVALTFDLFLLWAQLFIWNLNLISELFFKFPLGLLLSLINAQFVHEGFVTKDRNMDIFETIVGQWTFLFFKWCLLTFLHRWARPVSLRLFLTLSHIIQLERGLFPVFSQG